MTPTIGRRDRRQRRGEHAPAARGLDQGPAREDEYERRQEREVRGHRGAGDAREPRRHAHRGRMGPCPEIPHKGHDHDQRPRRGLAERQPIDHLRRAEPTVLLHRSLVYVRQHGISAAEGHECGLGKKRRHARQRPVATFEGDQQRHRAKPQHHAHGQYPRQPTPREARMGGSRAVFVDQRATGMRWLLRDVEAAQARGVRRRRRPSPPPGRSMEMAPRMPPARRRRTPRCPRTRNCAARARRCATPRKPRSRPPRVSCPRRMRRLPAPGRNPRTATRARPG